MMSSREGIAVTPDHEVPDRVPMQVESMSVTRLKKRYGRNLVFGGGIDIQEVLPFGEKEDIFAEVKDMIEILDRDGGCIPALTHRVRNDVSVKNLNIFFEAVQKFGTYA
jgi:uroporphyrinogen decarboxylase